MPAAHRLPDSTHVGAVRLQVTNLDRSLAYYTSVDRPRSAFADQCTRRASRQRRAAALARAGRTQPVRVRFRAAELLGLYHFAILLPDRSHLGRFVRHLATTGVRFSAADHFVSEALYLWDPDGLGIEVYADRPRDAWRMRGSELVMTTEPLDLESLVDAAGPDPWDGMPAGTTMGHMHLSVERSRVRPRLLSRRPSASIRRVWSYPGALFLSAGGYHHHLGLNTWAAGARRRGIRRRAADRVAPGPAVRG